MDLFLVIIDSLVIFLYIILIALISPYMMRLLKKRNCDLFFQLIPVLSVILMTSIAISFGYDGFKETLFFRLICIISFSLLVSLLFLTLIMKKLSKENYEKLLARLYSFRKRKEISLPK
ncbi:hypothetical protein [Sporosarcina limicola]|uniref:Cation transporter n=1 Tax=Sporosarcina limicola TaxID=34101 RepID=A0A927REE8_9BACL|nr:hypothetical protein [Sporosarcina limicola]MBE1556260.1 putative cation transporter [Sporosarcina limicola]